MSSGKKALSVILSLLLLLSILTACSGGSNSSEENDGGTEQTDAGNTTADGDKANPFEKHMEISLSHYNIGQAFPNRDSDEFLKALESRFNVTFVDRVISYSDYVEKFQLWSASGELPDLFSHDIINTGTYYSWIKQGIVRPLPDDLSAYPNILKMMNLEDVKGLKVDGKYYMIPRVTYDSHDQLAVERALIVRKDWMKSLNLQDPVTYEDYLNMLTAFAKGDPDKNNKDDTIGVTFRSTAMLMALGSGAFPNASNGSWVKENGQYIPFFASEKMKEFVTRMRELFTSGAIDPDFAIMKTNDGIEKFAQGKVGAISMQSTAGGLKLLDTAWQKYNKDITFTDVVKVIPVSWTAEDGSIYRFDNFTFWSETYFSSEVDDEKMERILHIYDYLLSDEFMTTKAYGLEGKDYKKEGDKFVITREKDENGKYKNLSDLYPSLHLFGSLAAWYQWMDFQDSEINKINLGEPLSKLVRDTLQQFSEYKPIQTNFGVQLLYTEAKTKLSAINPTEDVIKIILSKEDPVKMWEDIVKGYDDKGLEQAIKEVNDAVKEQGLDN